MEKRISNGICNSLRTKQTNKTFLAWKSEKSLEITPSQQPKELQIVIAVYLIKERVRLVASSSQE